MTHTVTIDEADRQMLILAMAKLCNERPGWDEYMESVAEKLGGRALYVEFKKLHGTAMRSIPADNRDSGEVKE